MDLPAEVIALAFQEGDIFFFEKNCPIGIPEHMHVCIRKHNTILLLSTCSSQIDTSIKIAQRRGYPAATYPVFNADNTNKFEKSETYVNCNEVVEVEADVFQNYISTGKIHLLKGKMDTTALDKIADGIRQSTVIEGKYKDMFL